MNCEICGKQIGDSETFILTLSIGGCDQDMSIEVCEECADEQIQMLSDASVIRKVKPETRE